MKNITLSAEEELIENARDEARRHNTTLNQMFRDWLADIADRQKRGREAHLDAVLDRVLPQANAGRKLTREEMNER